MPSPLRLLSPTEIAALAPLYDVGLLLERPERVRLSQVAAVARPALRSVALRTLEQHPTLIGANLSPTQLRSMQARSENLAAIAVAFRDLAQAVGDESLRLSAAVSNDCRGIYNEVRLAVEKRRVTQLRADLDEMADIMRRQQARVPATAKKLAAAAKRAGKASEKLERERLRQELAAIKAAAAKAELARLEVAIERSIVQPADIAGAAAHGAGAGPAGMINTTSPFERVTTSPFHP